MFRRFRFLTFFAVAHLLCLSSIAQLSIGQPDTDLLKRASSGNAAAMHLMGRAAAADGNPVEAYAWFSLATENGVETSEKSALFNALNSAQLAKATQRIEEIRSTHLRGLPAPSPKPAARVVEAKSPVEEKPVAPSPVAPAIAQPALDGQVEAQKVRIAKLEADLAAARSGASASKAQSDEWATSLETALSKANQTRDALSAEVAALKNDKLRAEESLAQLRAKPSLDGQVESQKAQIAKLETDLAAAQTETRAAKEKVGETTKLETALAKANQERDARSAEVAALRREKVTAEESLAQMRSKPSLDGQVESQKAQIAKLEADLVVAQTETRAAKEKVGETTRLEAALAKTGQEKEALSAEIATLRQDRLRAEQARDQIRADVSAARSKLETDLAAAQTEARVAKQKVGETTKLEAALAQATQERDTLSAEISTLRSDKQQAEESLEQLRAKPSLDRQVESQKAQIAKLEADLVTARAVDIAALRQDRLRAEEARDQMRAELSASRSKLEADLAAARIEARTAKAQVGESTTQLEAALAKATQQRDALSGEVAALRQEKLRAEESQKAQIVKLDAELSVARSETRAANTLSDDAATRLETALALASQELDARSREVATLRRDKLSAEESRDQMRSELSTARSKLENYDASIRDGALVDGNSHREALRQSEMKVDMANRRLLVVEQEGERLQARFREADSKAAASERAARNDSSEIERLRGELARTEQARIAALASREAAITELSAAQIRNDNIVRELARARPGLVLVSDGAPRAEPSRSPAPEPAAPEPRMHTVVQGETLSIISDRYYKTPGRWREIFNANRDVMTTENQLAPGMKLRIP